MIAVFNILITESRVTKYATPKPAVTVMLEDGASYDFGLKYVEQIPTEVKCGVIEESEEADKYLAPEYHLMEFADSNINFRFIFQAADRDTSLFPKGPSLVSLCGSSTAADSGLNSTAVIT